MSMKRKLSFLLLYGTLVLFGGLGALLLLFGEKAPHASLTENRMLAGFPQLSAETVRDGGFMSGLESFLSDNMLERDKLVQAASRLTALFSLEQPSEAAADLEVFEQVQSFAQGTEPETVPTAVPSSPAPDAHTPAPAALAPADTPAPTDAPDRPDETAVPADTEAPATSAAQAPSNAPALTEKDLSTVSDCIMTCTEKNGKQRMIYSFPKANVQRMIRLLNAYRAVLPEDGHMFFAQPPFPGVANYIRSGEYISWESDLEATINAYANDGVYMVSALDVLLPHLLNKEYLYFKTDHHWTPRAACYVANELLRQLGIDPKPYDEYSFTVYKHFWGSIYWNQPERRSSMMPDTLEVLIPETPVKGWVIQWDRSRKEGPFMVPNGQSYYAYLGGTLGPWRRFDTGVDCGRSCLVIGDSYDCCFIPFLAPYYETVHATDVRDAYYDFPHVKWSISEYIQENQIDDVYFVLSTASGVNTDYMIGYLYRFL